MKAIRAVITAFLVVLLLVTSAGLVWTQGHQPPAGALASAVVLGLGAIAGIVAIVAVWRWNPDDARSRR